MLFRSVSEYGICDASGNGGIDAAQAAEWVRVMDDCGISYVAWNLSDKAETSAILRNGCGKDSGFAWEDLSDSGRWLLDMLGSEGNAGKQDNGAGAGGMQDGGIDADSMGNESALPSRAETTGTVPGEESQTSDNLTVESKVVNSWEQNNETDRKSVV